MPRSNPDHAEPLGLTVHSLPAPGDALQRQRATGRLKMLLVLLVCAAPVLASYFLYYVVRPSSGSTAYSALVQPAVPMPALMGHDLEGRPLALHSQRGQWLMVVVDSGTCAAACEKRLFMQRQLREMTGRDRDRIDKLWLVVDDAPVSPVLRAALAASPAMTVLRVPRAALGAWLRPAEGQRLEDHLYIVDPLGDWMMRAPADADPAKLKRDVERLLRASAGWDKAGRQPIKPHASATAPTSAAAPGAAPASRP